jgi:hypothetical protein
MVANKIIMTPKQKAEDLYNTYLDYTQGKYNIKQCVLIAIDEFLPIISGYEDALFASQRSDEVEYWEEVKKEIEKL